MKFYTIGKDGSFTCGDTETGSTSYAYPTSEYANKAKRDPLIASIDMLHEETRSARMHDSQVAREYDMRNWQVLHDLEKETASRLLIKNVIERRMPTRTSSFSPILGCSPRA